MPKKTAKKTQKPKTPESSNKKTEENQVAPKANASKKPEQVPKGPLKASTAVTAQDVKPLDPGKAATAPPKQAPAAKRTRGPDKQPRKKRVDFNPEPEPEPEPEQQPEPEQELLVHDPMAAARATTTAFVKTFDIAFCGWCPPKLSQKDEKLLIELWTPEVYKNNDQIPTWLPASLVTLGIMADRIIKKIS